MGITEQEKEKSQCKGCIYNINYENCIHAGRVEMDDGKCLSKRTSWDIFDADIKKVDDYMQEHNGVPVDVVNAYHHGVRGFMSAMAARASLLQKHIDNQTIEVQTRSEETGLRFHDSIKQAFEHAARDKTVWKVSFSVGDERVRLVRSERKDKEGQPCTNYWRYEPLLPDEMIEEFKAKKR